MFSCLFAFFAPESD
nr:hypothetical protein [Escherichia coli]